MAEKKDALAQRAEAMEARAKEIAQIGSQDDYNSCVAAKKVIKEFSKEIDAWCDPNIQKWNQGHKAAVAEKKNLQRPLTVALGALNSGIVAWKNKQEKKALEARRKLEAKARADAEAERQAAAEALREAGEDDLADITEEMPVSPVVILEQKPETVKDDVVMFEHVTVEVLDKKAAAEFVMGNWKLLNHLLEINLKELRKMGIAQREHFEVPGCKCTVEKRVR